MNPFCLIVVNWQYFVSKSLYYKFFATSFFELQIKVNFIRYYITFCQLLFSCYLCSYCLKMLSIIMKDVLKVSKDGQFCTSILFRNSSCCIFVSFHANLSFLFLMAKCLKERI